MTAPCPLFGFDVRVLLDNGLSSHRVSVVREHFVHEVVEKNALVVHGEIADYDVGPLVDLRSQP